MKKGRHKKQEKDWLVRLRITSKSLSLQELSQVTGLRGGYGSFSKFEPIPKWLQILEKRKKYDATRLQISRESKDRKSAQVCAERLLRNYKSAILKAQQRPDCKVEVELGIECYAQPRPIYFTGKPALCNLCAQVGASIHIALV